MVRDVLGLRNGVALLLAAVVSSLHMAGAGAADVAKVRCGDAQVAVSAALSEDAASVCAGARRAVAFLGGIGLTTDRIIELEVLSPTSDKIPDNVYGCYDAGEDNVKMLAYVACSGLGSGSGTFGESMSRDLYESIAAHEVAHAIATANAAVGGLSRVAQEYIAYVTQLSTMSAQLRGRILARYARVRPDGLNGIAMGIWLMAPDVFAIRCYKHHLLPGGGAQFIRDLLSGSVDLRPLDAHP